MQGNTASGRPPATGQPSGDPGAPSSPNLPDQGRPVGVELIDRTVLTAECLALSLMDAAAEFDVSASPERSHAAGSDLSGSDIVLFNINTARLDDPVVRAAVLEQVTIKPATPVIVVAQDDDPIAAFEVIQLGARGYFPSGLSVALLVAAIRLVLAGGVFLPPNAVGHQPPAGQA